MFFFFLYETKYCLSIFYQQNVFNLLIKLTDSVDDIEPFNIELNDSTMIQNEPGTN